MAPADHSSRPPGPHVTFGFRRALVQAGDRVLLVDDWAGTGATATAVQQLAGDAGAAWIGAAVVVDGSHDSRLRRSLGLRSLLHVRDLPPVPRR